MASQLYSHHPCIWFIPGLRFALICAANSSSRISTFRTACGTICSEGKRVVCYLLTIHQLSSCQAILPHRSLGIRGPRYLVQALGASPLYRTSGPGALAGLVLLLYVVITYLLVLFSHYRSVRPVLCILVGADLLATVVDHVSYLPFGNTPALLLNTHHCFSRDCFQCISESSF